MRIIIWLATLFWAVAPAVAQIPVAASDESETVEAAPAPIVTRDSPADAEIAGRIAAIFANVEGLSNVTVSADSGVVKLGGTVAEPANIDRAVAIAERVQGVVTVENAIRRDARLAGNVAPVMERLRGYWNDFVRSLPLAAIALAIFVLFWIVGGLLARASGLWNRIAPNVFLGEALATLARLALILIGLVIALDIIGATALLGAILGGAGIIGIALGFAMKDSVENYVSSIMLSLRHPFRANDWVMIGDHEGHVIRLTSRATILMTLDGNHLRIPNSEVFKATILNFSTNPERRFEFELGIDADDDPAAAMQLGMQKLREQPFVLAAPDPAARLEAVGDSNIVLKFLGWIDQRETDFFKARSAAIRVVKNALEAEGFGLPEPIYRLRFDDRSSPLQIARAARGGTGGKDRPAPAGTASAMPVAEDVRRDADIDRKVQAERAATADQDMLDEDKPLE